VDQLKASNFSNNDISVLLPDKSGTKDFAHEQKTKAPEGAATGGVTGGVVGGTLGWLVGIRRAGDSRSGTVHRGGSHHRGAEWRGCGRRGRWHHGALVGLGIPEFEAKRYEGKIKNGNVLISVHTDDSDEVKRAKEIFKNAGAEDISSTGEASAPKDKDVNDRSTRPVVVETTRR
jgi:hypothetical protein